MGAAFYIMAILGCDDGQLACQQVRIVEARYGSRDECEAAAPRMLVASSASISRQWSRAVALLAAAPPEAARLVIVELLA